MWLAQPLSAVLRIIFVLLIAVLVRIVAHRLINKITSRAAQTGGNGKSDAARMLLGERRRQRAKALGVDPAQRGVRAHLRHRRGDHPR